MGSTYFVVKSRAPRSITDVVELQRDLQDDKLWLQAFNKQHEVLRSRYPIKDFTIEIYFAPTVYSIPELRYSSKQILPTQILGSSIL